MWYLKQCVTNISLSETFYKKCPLLLVNFTRLCWHLGNFFNPALLSFDKSSPIQQCHSRESGNPLACDRWIPAAVYPRGDGGQDDGFVFEDGPYPHLFVNLQKCGAKGPNLIAHRPFSRRFYSLAVDFNRRKQKTPQIWGWIIILNQF